MITLYYDRGSNSCEKAINWLKMHEIKFIKKHVSKLSKSELVNMLHLTENGFDDILKRTSKAGAEVRRAVAQLEKSSFEEAVNFILTHTNLLKVPIVIDEEKLLIGYHSEEIRVFLSKEYRNAEVS
ncbi:ArsC/Spx/MgsR family protein [Lactococcus petauri]|uniref:ArsC/Spx/MgsR family protein n=1 Tax=Lactococcus petauri TaxID=1940789 RepID=UPI0022E05DE9|nr:ArsC/Spx/MgsR family protein [Lactococcus petauri]